MNPSNSIDNHTIRNCGKKVFYELITNIDSINKDSPIALLNAVYQCEDYALLDENKDFIVNEKSFNYKSSFYLSFIANKDSVSEEYLKARKALYKSISKIKQAQAKELESQMQERAKANLDLKQRARMRMQKDKREISV